METKSLRVWRNVNPFWIASQTYHGWRALNHLKPQKDPDNWRKNAKIVARPVQRGPKIEQKQRRNDGLHLEAQPSPIVKNEKSGDPEVKNLAVPIPP